MSDMRKVKDEKCQGSGIITDTHYSVVHTNKILILEEKVKALEEKVKALDAELNSY
jgi:hypothetical protein